MVLAIKKILHQRIEENVENRAVVQRDKILYS